MNKRKGNIIGGFVAGFVFAAAALLLALRDSGQQFDLLARLAVAFLFLITTTLVIVALYAIFGRPNSREGKSRRHQFISGFQLAGGILLGFILMTALVGSSAVLFGTLHSSRLPRAVAACIAVGSVVLIVLMIDHWARYFAGWVGYSVFNGLLMLTSGHLLNNPSIPVPRWWSLSAIAMAVVSALCCMRFSEKYKLTLLDKAALMTWLLAFVLAVNAENVQTIRNHVMGAAIMWVGCVAVVIAWAVNRRTFHKQRRIVRTDRVLDHDPAHGLR